MFAVFLQGSPKGQGKPTSLGVPLKKTKPFEELLLQDRNQEETKPLLPPWDQPVKSVYVTWGRGNVGPWPASMRSTAPNWDRGKGQMGRKGYVHASHLQGDFMMG